MTGRPSKYKPEFADQARKLCELGATDLEIANFLEVDLSTINRWKVSQPDFCESLKRGKDVADDLVESRLFARATGYSHDAVKIFLPKDADEPVYAPYVEHHAPDTTAAIFCVKNRRPEKWRDRQQHDHTIGFEASLLEFLDRIDGGSSGLPVKD